MLTWVLCIVVIVPAMTWGLSTVQSAFSATVPTRTVADGETIVVDLDPADAPAIYLGIEEAGVGFQFSSTHSIPVDTECVIRGDAEGLDLLQPEGAFSITTGDVQWHQLFLIQVPTPGTYEVQCTGEGARFGVAKDLPEGLFSRSMALLAGILAVAAAAVVTTIVLVRKRRAARSGFAAYGPPRW